MAQPALRLGGCGECSRTSTRCGSAFSRAASNEDQRTCRRAAASFTWPPRQPSLPTGFSLQRARAERVGSAAGAVLAGGQRFGPAIVRFAARAVRTNAPASNQASPPCTRAAVLAIASPRPWPRFPSRLANRSNIRSGSTKPGPGPSSRTSIRTHSSQSVAMMSTRRRACRRALSKRLPTACLSSPCSASATTGAALSARNETTRSGARRLESRSLVLQ